MSRILFAIIMISWLASGCGNNKRIISKNASKSVASKRYTTAKTNSNLQSSELSEENSSTGKNTVNEIVNREKTSEQNNAYRPVSPKATFKGASGIGTGGSYASNYYGSESAKNKKKTGNSKSDSLVTRDYENSLTDTYQEDTQDEMEADSLDQAFESQEYMEGLSSPQSEQTMEEEYSW